MNGWILCAKPIVTLVCSGWSNLTVLTRVQVHSVYSNARYNTGIKWPRHPTWDLYMKLQKLIHTRDKHAPSVAQSSRLTPPMSNPQVSAYGGVSSYSGTRLSTFKAQTYFSSPKYSSRMNGALNSKLSSGRVSSCARSNLPLPKEMRLTYVGSGCIHCTCAPVALSVSPSLCVINDMDSVVQL